MTENVKTFELKINGINSVKDLKNHISDLRDELVRLDDTSEEYSSTVEELIESEKKLKSVMSATKESLSSSNGSYNALVNEMSALKKVWREVTSEAERAKIGERIGEINEELKRMDSTIGNNQRKVGSYEDAIKKALMTPQQELKKLKKELAGLEQGTEEYNATFKRMAELTHDITEQQEMLKWSSADLGDILGNLAGVAQGVAGGFSAINAISGLVSDGNEDVEKAMLTTQRWLQLIQGLGALEELGDRIRGLWTGIKNYTQAQEVSISSMKDYADTTENTGGAVEGTSQAISRQSTVIKQTTTDILKLKEGMKLLNEEELKELETLNQQLNMMNQNIVARVHAIADVEDMIEAEIISREEGEKSIKIHKQILEVDKQTYNEIEKRIGQIKTQTDANKVLSNSQKNVGNSTSWLNAQTQKLNATFLTMQGSTNKFVAGMGKAGTAVMALGATIKTALISTGIGILIVALGTAISSLWKYVDGSAKAEERTKALADANDKLNESLEKQDKNWERQEKLMQAQGKSYQEIYEAEMKYLQAKLKEVQATLATQQAIAKEIGERKLQKEKYAEFRQELQDMVDLEKELKTAIEDLNWDKYVEEEKKKTNAVKEQQKAEEERKKKATEAYNARMKELENERKTAKKLYEELQNYYKTDTQKLKEKYNADLKTLDKLNASEDEKLKAKQLLRTKYLNDLNKLNMDNVKAVYDENRKYAQRAMEIYGTDSEEYLTKQIEEATRFRGEIQATIDNINQGVNATEALNMLNIFEGTDIRNMEDANVELQIANKNITDLQKQLLELQTTKAINKLSKGLEAIGSEANNALNKHDLSFELQASTSFNGFYSGLSPEQQKAELDARYNLQAEYLQRELELYQATIAQKNLTDEERTNLQNSITAIQMAQQDLTTQHTIESNYLIIDSYNNMASSIQGIASSITDILGTVSDAIMDNAEAQLEAGEITEEEYNRQFEKSKAIQIATATINTIAGALGAFMGITKDTGGWGIALAIAEATAVMASGMAQIQKIRNTKPNSTSGGNARYAEVTPSSTGDFNPTLTQNVTGGQETENLANALSKTPLWVSVVDINNAQQKSNVRVSESTF